MGLGAGILVSSSTATEVVGNTVARNADGISVISQARGRGYGDAVHDVTVDSNTVIDGGSGFLLAWLQDWDGHLFDSAAANRGTGNTFSSPASRRQPCQFEWDGCRSIEGFAGTPGGATSRYLITGEAQAALGHAGLSETPGPSPATAPPAIQAPPAEQTPHPRELPPSLVIASGFVAAALLGAMLFLRRRRATGV